MAAASSGLAPAVSSKFSSIEFLDNVPSSRPRLSIRRKNGCKQTSRDRDVNTVYVIHQSKPMWKQDHHASVLSYFL